MQMSKVKGWRSSGLDLPSPSGSILDEDSDIGITFRNACSSPATGAAICSGMGRPSGSGNGRAGGSGDGGYEGPSGYLSRKSSSTSLASSKAGSSIMSYSQAQWSSSSFSPTATSAASATSGIGTSVTTGSSVDRTESSSILTQPSIEVRSSESFSSVDDDCTATFASQVSDRRSADGGGESSINVQDLFELLKFSYILQETHFRVGDLASVPRPAHELLQEIHTALSSKTSISKCSNSSKKLTSRRDSSDEKQSNSEIGSGKIQHSRKCEVGSLFRQLMQDELVGEGLLDPLLQYLVLDRKLNHAVVAGTASGPEASGPASKKGDHSASGSAMPKRPPSNQPSAHQGGGGLCRSSADGNHSSNHLSPSGTPGSGLGSRKPTFAISRTTSSTCLVNNSSSSSGGGGSGSGGGSSGFSSNLAGLHNCGNQTLTVPQQLRRSASSSSLTRIAAFNRIHQHQQQRNIKLATVQQAQHGHQQQQQQQQQQQSQQHVAAGQEVQGGARVTTPKLGTDGPRQPVVHEAGQRDAPPDENKAPLSNDDDRDEQRPAARRQVTIHVCDEARDAKRDFTCPQDLLLSQMGYFQDIASGQSLEDVDISVHCDIDIFEWLMAWMMEEESAPTSAENRAKLAKSAASHHSGPRDDETTAADLENKEQDDGGRDDGAAQSGVLPARVKPVLEPSNVVSILVSASFLKMTPLVDIGLKYLHGNMNKILIVTHNLNCLGEPLLNRLAQLYKPSEVEELLDRRDRIHSRLYIKLIVALFDPLPKPDREMFNSAATLFRCKLCGQYLTKRLSQLLPCHPLRSLVNHMGEVVPKHLRDEAFNVNEFIKNLRAELKSWRKVFWRLWGMVHYLYCSLCTSHFQAYLLEFCGFHPQDPEFPTIQFKNSCQPFGVYQCCNSHTNRFQPLPPHDDGCQSRDHRVRLKNRGTPIMPLSVAQCRDEDDELMQEREVFRLLMAHRGLICLCPTKRTGTNKFVPDSVSITLPVQMNLEKNDDTFSKDASLVPPMRPRRLVNRTLWETLRTSIISGALRKKKGALFSVVKFLTGATAGGGHQGGFGGFGNGCSFESVVGSQLSLSSGKGMLAGVLSNNKALYGRLKKVPKLPAKPVLQSSESSSATDELSGSEDSGGSSCLEENDGRDHDTTVSNLGMGCSEDEPAAGGGYAEYSGSPANDFPNASDSHLSTAGGVGNIEVKLNKESGDRTSGSSRSGGSGPSSGSRGGPSSGLRGGGSPHLASLDHLGGRGGGPASSSSSSGAAAGAGNGHSINHGNHHGGTNGGKSDSWMRWDPDRAARTNQDFQREREEVSMRLLVCHLTRKFRPQQHHLHQQQQQQHQQQQLKQGPGHVGVKATTIPYHSTFGFANVTSHHGRWGSSSMSASSSSSLSASGSAPHFSVTPVYFPPGVIPPGGIYVRLEQDWKETHLAYLHHRSTTTSLALASHLSTSSSSPNLRVTASTTRPNSAASLRSGKHPVSTGARYR